MNVLNNKTIFLLNLAEYPQILAFSAYGFIAGLIIRRYSALFCRIIVNCSLKELYGCRTFASWQGTSKQHKPYDLP